MGNDASWQEAITSGRFAGKTIIVTGAASGIGRATALRIAKEGGKVVAADISKDRLDALVEENAG
ncbi:SDR family NAD(P)-dependent oxidoreductase, partial [Paenarthrobacter sp. CM16]|uniref:SDR family NAD(P)-dependent oxidoreductase n=1 Tax=Paenarthrobacter sp. CM16 TaxID=2738447 RepID=UPI001552719A